MILIGAIGVDYIGQGLHRAEVLDWRDNMLNFCSFFTGFIFISMFEIVMKNMVKYIDFASTCCLLQIAKFALDNTRIRVD